MKELTIVYGKVLMDETKDNISEIFCVDYNEIENIIKEITDKVNKKIMSLSLSQIEEILKEGIDSVPGIREFSCINDIEKLHNDQRFDIIYALACFGLNSLFQNKQKEEIKNKFLDDFKNRFGIGG